MACTIVKPGIYYIRSSDGTAAIDCPGGNNQEALELKCSAPAPVDSQKWAVTYDALAGTYNFQNVASGNYIGAHYPEHVSKLPPGNVIGGPISSGKAVPWEIKMSQPWVYSIRGPDFNLCFNNAGLDKGMTFAVPNNGTQRVGFDGCKLVLIPSQLWSFQYVGPLFACPAPNNFLSFFPNALPVTNGTCMIGSLSRTGRNLGVDMNNCGEDAPLVTLPANENDPYQHWDIVSFPASLTCTLLNRGCGLYLAFPYFDRKAPYKNDDWKVRCTMRSRAKHWSIFSETGGLTINMPGTRWQVNLGQYPACGIALFPTPRIPPDSKFQITAIDLNRLSPDSNRLPDGVYRIVSSQNTLITGVNVSTITAWGEASGALANFQEWSLVCTTPNGPVYRYAIQHTGTGLYVSGTPQNNAAVVPSKTPKQWLIVPSCGPSGGYYICDSEADKFAVTLYNNKAGNNAFVGMWALTGLVQQIWQFQRVSNPQPSLSGPIPISKL